ncbi:MAG: hypothetical protein ABEI77_08140 [Halorientalis sp.]
MSGDLITRLLGRSTAAGSSSSRDATDGILDRYDPDLDRLAALTGNGQVGDGPQSHLTRPVGVDSETVRKQARRYREHGSSADGFVASYGVVTEALVTAAFEEVREAADAEAINLAESQLSSALVGTLDSIRAGVSAYVQGRSTRPRPGFGKSRMRPTNRPPARRKSRV